jgi:hypothetical protein
MFSRHSLVWAHTAAPVPARRRASCRPLSMPAAVGARTASLTSYVCARLPQLCVELARAQFDALWAGLGCVGDPPAKRRRATPVSSARAVVLHTHASRTVRSPANGSDLNGAYPLGAVYRGPVHQVHGVAHGFLSRWIKDPWLGRATFF